MDKINQKKRLSEDETANIIMQLLSAIKYLHSKNIMHSDLKPDNILLEDDSEYPLIKLIDFGNAQICSNFEKKDQKYGTLYYMAPEVLKKNYDKKADIWSCGVIMYILLSGQFPFDGENDNEITNNVSKGYYSFHDEIWKSISENGKDLIKKLLTYRPENRISASEVLKHKWFESEIQRSFSVQLSFIRGYDDYIKEYLRRLKKFRSINYEIEAQHGQESNPSIFK